MLRMHYTEPQLDFKMGRGTSLRGGYKDAMQKGWKSKEQARRRSDTGIRKTVSVMNGGGSIGSHLHGLTVYKSTLQRGQKENCRYQLR